jgi:dipeptidyl aminopeptidase/acylaminoacyl peptidase
MFLNKKKFTLLVIIALAGVSGTGSTIVLAQQAKHRFGVADEIGLRFFAGSWTTPGEGVLFSPDGKSFVVWTERGRLDLNKVEDSLWFYRSEDIENFLRHPDVLQLVSPVWVVNRSGKQYPVISDWRWLDDSSGVAYLEHGSGGNNRLVLCDLRKKTLELLTSKAEAVASFDIRDQHHYVYTAPDPAETEKAKAEPDAPAIVGTGRTLFQLVLPDNPYRPHGANYLWAVVGSKRFKVMHDGTPFVPGGHLALSSDGHSLVATMVVSDRPSSWERLYPPPYASDPYRNSARDQRDMHQYIQTDMQTGSVESLTDAPLSWDAGAWASVTASPSWSRDGKAILLPNTFLNSGDNKPSRPCIAVVDLASKTRTCVELLKGRTETGAEEGYRSIRGVHFVGGDRKRVAVTFHVREQGNTLMTEEYRRTSEGTWQVVAQSEGELDVGQNGLEVTVRQGLNEPPVLVATNKGISRVIWDPNPQLKNIEFGETSVYTWKDKEGRTWRGGLFKPVDYKTGQRYPLVIQTHGFLESEFRPSGGYTTAFAARALATAGIAVLVVTEDCPLGTPSEAVCAVSGYEAGANRLVSEGLVDPEKIGMIGWSRTGFYVMKAITASSLHVAAASVTDSTLVDYFQYLALSGFNQIAHEYESMIGARPFGEGLQQWLKRSPGFNLDKVTAPLLVVGDGPATTFDMWGLYAGLHNLERPVDLIMLNTDEHILTNPAVRMASQGGSVDWFRFWLKSEEDPDPAKKEQYGRWRELRKMQDDNNSKARAANERPAPVN